MLPAADRAMLRGVLAPTFSDRCEVLRSATVPDGSGGMTETVGVAATYDCLVTALSTGEREAIVADRATSQTQWLVKVSVGADVRATDRLRIVGRGLELDVVAVLGPQTTELSRWLQCQKG